MSRKKQNQPKKQEVEKSTKAKLCLRMIDANNIIMSSDPQFKEAPELKKSQKLPKGMIRIDAHNVIKA